MSRQIKKISAILLALALVFVSSAVMSQAANTAQAAITKILEVPQGTEIPAIDFDFTITPVDVDGTAYDGSNMPTLGTAGAVTISIGSASNNSTNAGITSYWNESAELIDFDWSAYADGTYVYTIKETGNDWTDPADPIVAEILSASQAEYTLSVYVENGETWAVIAAYVQDDAGNNAVLGDKVDPTPGGDGTTTFNSQLIFNAQYAKFVGTDPEDASFALTDAPLIVSKAITGSHMNASDEFDFTMTVTMPSFVGVNADFTAFSGSYDAYLFEGGAIVDTPAVVKVTFVSGTANTFKLKGGQSLVFANLPVGASFSVTEDAFTGYVPSVAIHGTTIPGSLNTALSTGLYYIMDPSAGQSIAAYTNDASAPPPTGLNMNTLPFYAMIILSISAMGVYLAAKTRKRKAQQF